MESKENSCMKLPYWSRLSDEERKTVQESCMIRCYAKGEFIHGGITDCLGMIMVLSGEIRAYIVSEEGREITLFRLHQGDPCVFSASCAINQLTFDTMISAETDCALLVIPTGTFARLTEENIYVRCFMYELIAERFGSVMWTMQQILFKGFDRRLAAFLVMEYEHTGKLEIKMTHEQIAQHTNSAREVVARMLKRFASDDLVEVKRGMIRLKNLEELKKMA